MMPIFLCGRYELTLERPLIMGIVNVTPDSFSDGGEHFQKDKAIDHARRLVRDGADILDIGGESTRPGAVPVSVHDELGRILPVLEALRHAGVPLSVDTFKPEVMRRALDAGADIINDIYAFRQPGALQAVADSSCGLCVMHMQGEPQTMQQAPQYNDVVQDIKHFFQSRLDELSQHGIQAARIVLDPGFGFGKTAAQNYELLRRLEQLKIDAYPFLLGVSRKSMIAAVTGRAASGRLAGSIAAALAGVARGAQILRVHDVAETADAIKVWQAVEYGVV